MSMALAVLYDEDCGICVKTAGWIRRLDPSGKTDCIAALSEEREQRFPDLDPVRLMEAMHCVDESGKVFIGHEGCREILKRLPLFPISWLWYLPGWNWLADKGYRWVADNRPRECKVGKMPSQPQ